MLRAAEKAFEQHWGQGRRFEPAIPTILLPGSMATNLGPWEFHVPEAIQFQRPARRLERRQVINDTSIRSIKPPATGAVDYFDDLTPGLSLRVTSNDVRTWTVFCRDKNARQKRLALGRYPAVKLVDARELARDAQRSVWRMAPIPEGKAPPVRC